MKFTKTAIAVAIAGLAATPMMAAADTTLSGLVELRLSAYDKDLVGVPTDPDNADPDDEVRIGTGDVLFGLTSSHELNSGLTGYSSLRVDFNDLSTGANGENDSVYVGIKGGFGDIRIGELGPAVEFGQKSTDIFDVGDDINGGIGYTGSFGPASIGVQFSPEQNEDMVGVGAAFNVGGFGVGLGAETRNELSSAAAGVTFAFAGATIGAHFWTQEQAAAADGDKTSFAVNAGYAAGAFSGGVTITHAEDDGTFDRDAVRLDLKYDLGGSTTINSRITAVTDNNDSNSRFENTNWRIQLSKAF